MARKALGLDRDGVQKVMHIGDYWGDSLGQVALNAISSLIGQLTYFYTDKVGIAAGAVATMLLICKIVDAFTDIIMGNIVDHTKPGRESIALGSCAWPFQPQCLLFCCSWFPNRRAAGFSLPICSLLI